jgi:hypothetical protein
VAEVIAASRIQISCPVGSPPLLRGANHIIGLLLRHGRGQSRGGFTYSEAAPPAFTGYFWDVDPNHREQSCPSWSLDGGPRNQVVGRPVSAQGRRS